jgi:multidrug/hemolysin transport system ATP-binding protein
MKHDSRAATLPAIRVRNLVKNYGTFRAINKLTFDVPKGSVFAFLGTNGAGKSTTIECITTVLEFDEGVIRINNFELGKDNLAIRNDIGVVFQNSLLDPLLTVKENLLSRASFYDLSESDMTSQMNNLAKLIDLEPILNRRYGKLSGGQRRRVDIARGLMHNPNILFLDEPTAGLDPQSRRQVWDTLHMLRNSHELTIFLTTHYMEETEEADNVLIIEQGNAVASGTPSELRRQFSRSILTITPHDQARFIAACDKQNIAYEVANGAVLLDMENSEKAMDAITSLRQEIKDFEFRHGTMDDVFLALTEKGEGR